MPKIPELQHHIATQCDIDTLVSVFNRSFKGYIGGEIAFTNASFQNFILQNSIDLNNSSVGVLSGEPVGLALISRIGWNSRLAAMGVVDEHQGNGIGTWLLNIVINQTRDRGDRSLELECIEQNIRGVRLYRNAGFKILRRLQGFTAHGLTGTDSDNLQEVNIASIAKMVEFYGAYDLPWQISGHTLAKFGPPNKGLKLGPAYGVISKINENTIAIKSLFVLPDARNQGFGKKLLKSLFHCYPEKDWVVSPICPEEYGAIFLKLGFQYQTISQFHMSLGIKCA